MSYLGNFSTGATVNAYFLTVSSSGEASASTSVAVHVYRDATTERSTEGVTVTAAHGGSSGAHMLQVVMTSTFYTTGDYFARITAGTVDSRQLTGYSPGCWSVKNTNRHVNVGMWNGSTAGSTAIITGTSTGATITSVGSVGSTVEANVVQWRGGTPNVLSSGAIDANIEQILGSTGDFSSGALPANVEQVNGSTAGSTATIIGVSTGATITSVESVSSTVAANVVQWAGSTVGALSSGAVPANLQQIQGSTAGFSSGAVPANVQQVNGSTAGSTATIIGVSTGATITSVESVTSGVNVNRVHGSTAGSTDLLVSARLNSTGVDDIWDEVVDGSSMTGRQSLRLANAANAGLTSGAGSTAFNIRDIDNTVNRIAATVSTGNRTAITLNVSS